MKILFQTAAAAFASVPGLAALLKGLGVPPDPSLNVIFGALASAVGVLTLLMLYLRRAQLKRTNQNAIIRKSIASLAAGVLLALTYVGVYNYCVISSGPKLPVYAAFLLPPDVNKLIEEHGGREGALEFYGSAGLQDLVNKAGPLSIMATTTVLLLLYLAVVVLMTTAFGLIGVKLQGNL